MTIKKKNLFIVSLLFLINPLFAQISDECQKTNPVLELFGSNSKTLNLKGNVAQMHEQQFSINAKGDKTENELINTFYKFSTEGATKEFEQNYKYLKSEKHFFSYTNKGYISHVDIETLNLAKKKDTLNTILDSTAVNEPLEPSFSTVDCKYVQKKNILYKGEESIEGSSPKKTTRKESFYHFNDYDQIILINHQSDSISTKYIYDANGLVKETQTFKSDVLSHKNIYKYDHDNNLIKITTINSDNTTKYPNKEIAITYKFDPKGNIIEKKMMAYLYSPKGIKEFIEGFLNVYNYVYL
ncbi:hypothetical protein [Flavobacterium aquiphilum]|uniref:hypothetical protein n=1 Tax=Flavobacterium aquiphilum TaxID=3003261 RepID=UPI0024804034|nr:hypothetical protein [Flavobacterium aquiphilum]